MTGKWSIIVNDNSKAHYARGNEITYNTKVLEFNLCDYDAYILVTRDTIIIGDNGHGVAFKNCVSITKCITNIDGTTKDDAEYLDFVMPMYILVEYSYNYSETRGSLWFYSKDEAISFNTDIANDGNIKSFKYKETY